MAPKRSTVTIHDVARAAGVSSSTASRVLNNKDDVAPETYDKVRQVMDALNYTPSLAAKSLRSRATKVLGLVLPDLTEPFMIEIVKGVGQAIKAYAYDLLVYTGGGHPFNRRASWEQEHVALLSSGLTDGTIVVTPSAREFPANAHIVVVDPQDGNSDVPSVIATNRAGAISAMEYLFGLGHRRIGFIGGNPATQSAIRRLHGYCESLAAAGLGVDRALIREGDYTRERGRDAALQLLQLPERPTAIFAANDTSAGGVIEAAGMLGLRIPQDLSLIGFDNIPEAAQFHPGLTTIDQSIQEIGQQAIKLLVDLVQGNTPEHKQVKVPTQLIVRESCQPL
ncbi:LacI family transcriptional regulator [Candidatus Gracilibacteria bacterium]|nr:LacI family transcriptional regulator [Candidatus Gracilibacteria bacterium]